MKSEPFSFHYPLADFDLAKLPIAPELLRENPEMLVSAIQSFYADFFRPLGGQATVLVNQGLVSVAWYPEEGDASSQLSDHALKLLRQGDYRGAEPLLRALLARDENDADTLYNLGMMLSDQRKLTEATALLQRFVDLVPDSSNGWTALGVAESRKGNLQGATFALKQALKIDPKNGYALRNLGAVLGRQSPEDALPILEQAARLMPQDQAAQYGYAQMLLESGRSEEADAIFIKTISLSPLSEIAELARTARTSIAHQNMRDKVDGGVRPDVVLYIVDALQKFRAMGDAKTQAVAFEIALLGRSGLNINDPDQRYTLRSLPGSFSGMQLVSLMYTGFKVLKLDADCGIDLSQEFAEAVKMPQTRKPPSSM